MGSITFTLNDLTTPETRSTRVEETSMNEINCIKQYSRLISIERAGMNQVDRHFEDLEYLNSISIQYL